MTEQHAFTQESSGHAAIAWLIREPEPSYPPAPKRRLLDQVRDAIRARHYSYRTEEAYIGWIRRYILFHGKRHPLEMGKPEIEQFLTALAVERHLAASTQNQALAGILFLYKEALGKDPGWLDDVVRAKRPQRLPVVLTRPEVRDLLNQLSGVPWIMAMLLYGSGLRLMECSRLRVKDVDFERGEILVREGKGNKDRVTMLGAVVREPLRRHLERVWRLHQRDLQAGLGRVQLPEALTRKYPNADREWGWQWVFPAARICRDPAFGAPQRLHLHESVLQRAVREARRRARIVKPAGPHTLRHCFATHLLRGWVRHQNGARTAGAPRCSHDDDLYPCPQPGRACGEKSGRRTARAREQALTSELCVISSTREADRIDADA